MIWGRPFTVRAVVYSRLSRLSPSAVSLLAAGAVLESEITFEHMCAIANIADDAALSALDELVSGQLLLEIASAGTAISYTFTHNMIRDTVYTEAGDARRRLFHHRALDILEEKGNFAAILAHHVVAADLPEDAFRLA